MTESKQQSNIFYRVNKSIASSKLGARLFSRVLHHLDKPVFRLSKGKHSAASIFTGLPLIMLTTTGANSGLARTVPLLALPDGSNFTLIASNWGQSHYPSWYYNLRANPEASITIQGESRRSYVASEANGEERERLWQKAVQTYAGYTTYKQRITAGSNRSIPIMLMTPLPGTTAKAKTQD